MAMSTPTMVKLALRWPRKLILEFTNSLRPSAVVKVRLAKVLLRLIQLNTRRLRYTAVKNEQMRPIISVVAKPLIGPVPKSSRITPVMMEVRLESKIAEKALL